MNTCAQHVQLHDIHMHASHTGPPCGGHTPERTCFHSTFSTHGSASGHQLALWLYMLDTTVFPKLRLLAAMTSSKVFAIERLLYRRTACGDTRVCPDPYEGATGSVLWPYTRPTSASQGPPRHGGRSTIAIQPRVLST